MASCFDAAPNLFFPAIVTPLRDDGALDEPSARALCAHHYAAGAGGLYVLGGTGEGMHLSVAARKAMAAIAVEETAAATARLAGGGACLCMVHVGAARPDEALELAAHAKQIGASSVSSLPPHVGHSSFEYTERFYGELARACAPVPVIAYHIPAMTHVNFTADQLAKLLDIPGVVGYKYTDTDLGKMDALLARRPGAVIFHGISPMQAPALLYGARGGITGAANCVLAPLVAVHALWKAGKRDEAMAAQREFNRANEALNSTGPKLVQALKQLLVWQGVIAGARCAAREEMGDADLAAFRAKCEANALIQPTLKK